MIHIIKWGLKRMKYITGTTIASATQKHTKFCQMLGFCNPLTLRNLTTVMSYRYNNTTTAPLIPLDDAVAVVASLLLLC